MVEEFPGSGDTGGWDRDNEEKILRGVEEDRKTEAAEEAERLRKAREAQEAAEAAEAREAGDELAGDIQEEDITDEGFPPERSDY